MGSTGGKPVCMLHGPGHSTESCRTPAAQAKKMKTSYQSQEATPRFKKKESNMITQALCDQFNSKKRKKDKELKTLRSKLKRFRFKNPVTVLGQNPTDG